MTYGGNQKIIHPIIIDEHDDFLGKYTYPTTSHIKVKDVQTFRFGPDDHGPFWMTK